MLLVDAVVDIALLGRSPCCHIDVFVGNVFGFLWVLGSFFSLSCGVLPVLLWCLLPSSVCSSYVGFLLLVLVVCPV